MECSTRDTQWGSPGKLRAAARRWIGGGAGPDETDAALAAFGLTQEIEGEADADAPLPVYAFNWTTLSIFISTWNQWHVVVGKELVRIGMSWGEVESALRLSGIKRSEWPVIFEGLQVMQNEALTIFNERSMSNA